MKRFQAVPASRQRYGLGEGPVWDSDRDRVLWVDINCGMVHTGTLSANGVTQTTALLFAETVGAVVSARDGQLLVAGARRLYRVDGDGVVSGGKQILADHIASRLNDGTCDPAGRLLIGSLALDDRVGEEVLVRIERDGRITVLDDDLGLSNGLAFTPQGDRLYSIDTTPGIVWVRDYDPDSGTVGDRTVLLDLEGESPDGLCTDIHGDLWIAMWGGGEVRCYSPGGDLLAAVEVAAPNTTSVAFVGATLETLLITTASEQLSDEQGASCPDSGRLFTAEVGVSGLPVPAWSGS